jgi:hypothetical protein
MAPSENQPVGDPLRVRQIVQAGQGALAVAVAWFWHRSDWEDPLLTVSTLLILVAGVWPILRWLAKNDSSYPIVELLLLTTVPFYAIPVLTGQEELAHFSESVLHRATLVVLVFQVACMAGSAWSSHNFRGQAKPSDLWQMEILPENRLHFTAFTAVLNTAWIILTNQTDWISTDMSGTFRAIFTGISVVSIFVQARLWGHGQLSQGHKALFVANLFLQVVLLFQSLLLINGIGLLFTAMVGYFTTSRRVPWLPIAVLLPIISILHNGKSAMRSIYWNDGIPEQKMSSLPDYFTQWFNLGLNAPKSANSTQSNAITYGLMRRASLFQIVCVTVATIPDKASYLEGESYTVLPAQIIPRFLWPSKPSPHLSVSLMSVQLGLLTIEETETTSIGFGMLTEAYANFGYFGVALLGVLFGCAFEWLSLTTLNSPTFSPAGLCRILCLIWCINAETTLAVWLSSFYQACVAIILPVWLLRPFLAQMREPRH